MWLGLSKQNFLTLLLSPILLLRRTLTTGYWQLTAWQWTWTTPFDSLATVILLVWSKSWLLPCFCKKHRTLKIIHLMIWDSLKRIVFLQFLMSSRLEQKFNSKKKFKKIQNSNSKTSFQFKKRGGWVLWRDWEKCLHQGRGALTQQAGGGREQVSAETTFYQGDHQQQGGAPAWRVVSKREAIRSKHGGPGHRGQGVVQGAHGRILKSSGSGRRLGRWSLGATEERRRGRGFLGHVCERESLIQSVMLYLVSWEFCQCLKRAHAESTCQ